MTLYADLGQQTARLGHRPAVVYRDADTGERTELSFATLYNWVSKAANLLVEQLDAGLGTDVALDLPLHWMAPVVAHAAWAVGATVSAGDSGDLLVAHEEDAPERSHLLIGAGMAGRLVEAGPGDALTTMDILGQPDDFIDDPGDEGAWAIGGRSQSTLAEQARGLDGADGPVLVVGDRVEESHIVDFARLLTAGVGVVLARGFDRAGLEKLAAEEGAA